MLEQRRAGEADKGRIGQRKPHVAGESACLRTMRFIRNDDDVVAQAIRLLGVNRLVELVDEPIGFMLSTYNY